MEGKRGTLRVYLGSAPGVGKTFAMLSEGHRRFERGTDVVVAFVETHDRALTAELVRGLEVVPRKHMAYRESSFTEMDIEAVLARRPEVALVDELAHTNVPGSKHVKRWQDIEELLAAGINVISTVNIQHLESLNDVVESITGVRQQETVPDRVVRRADQIELVDMSPQALRRRLAHGNVYQSDKIDAALSNYFRVGNLTALRELALLWTADRVDDALRRYRDEHGIEDPWPARERVVVAVTGGRESEALLRRGARIVERASGGELLALHVLRNDGLTDAPPEALTRLRQLAESLGATWHSVIGDDIGDAVLEFARGANASQLVLGASRRGGLSSALSPGVGPRVVRDSGDIDVHIVTHDEAGRGTRRLAARRLISRRRTAVAWLLTVFGTALLTVVLYVTRDIHDLPIVLMLFLGLTVVVALVGGLWPALVAAIAGGLLANYFFTPPLYTFTVADPENALSILIIIAVALAVSWVVDQGARRTAEAARARAEADTLTLLAGSVLRGDNALAALLNRLRETFGMLGVALLSREGLDAPWQVTAETGTDIVSAPDLADNVVPVHDGLAIILQGHQLSTQDMRIALALGLQADAVLERDRLRAQADETRSERERTAMRTALLAAVSHDLRTPLAAIKAAISSLRSTDVELAPDDKGALLEDVDLSADRLALLIDNLLDMSRIDADAVHPVLGPVALEEVIPRAIPTSDGQRVNIAIPPDLPDIVADPGLLERVLANIVENALKYSPENQPVIVTAGEVKNIAFIRVVDRGKGISPSQRDDIFVAFQRLGDAPAGHGVGLGLAVARGFTEAMGGTLEAEDTPGGGLTMLLTMPLAARNPQPTLPASDVSA